MERFMYRAQLKRGYEDLLKDRTSLCAASLKKLVGEGALMTLTIFILENQLYLYYECCSDEIKPHEMLPDLDSILEDWPGVADFTGSGVCGGFRKWVRMTDIFDSSTPYDAGHWKRKQPVARRVGKLGFLKPEKVAAYVYYHYQLQTGSNATDNKYCTIAINENVLFYYDEEPHIEDRHPEKEAKGMAVPIENWQQFMDTHFFLWEGDHEGDRKFKPMEHILSI